MHTYVTVITTETNELTQIELFFDYTALIITATAHDSKKTMCIEKNPYS